MNLRTRFSRILTALFVAAGLALVGAGSAAACGFDCVNQAPTVTRMNDGARITFSTSVPVLAEATANTRQDETGLMAGRDRESTYSTQHSLYIGGLRTNTRFWFRLTLTAQNGTSFVRRPSVYQLQTFLTLHRLLVVRFQNIRVIDDSDNWSPGDLTVHFRVGWNVTRLYHYNNVDWASGVSSNPNLQLNADDSPQVTQILVEAYDDDVDWGGFCRLGSPAGPHWTTGSHECGQWSTAQQFVDLRSHAPGWRLLPDMASPGLPRFVVSGSYYVGYYA